MTCKYAVTFETESTAETVYGIAKGSSVRSLAARAAEDARKRHPRHAVWQSMVIVLEKPLPDGSYVGRTS